MTSPADRLAVLGQIYDEIHEWAATTDPAQVRREIVPSVLDAEVAVVGQALGRDTQRLSGLPYVLPSGELSRGGTALDGFLNRFGYSIDARPPHRYAYSTDLVPRFPGRKSSGTGDRRPSDREIQKGLGWLEREIAVVRPRVVVLLGAMAARAVLDRYAGVSARRLEEVAGQRFDAQIGDLSVAAVPIYHPSGAWQFPTKAPAALDAAAAAIASLLSRER